MLIINILGIIIIADAILSLALVEDKQMVWQIGRAVRLGIGLYLSIWSG